MQNLVEIFWLFKSPKKHQQKASNMPSKENLNMPNTLDFYKNYQRLLPKDALKDAIHAFCVVAKIKALLYRLLPYRADKLGI